jgi:hypothetical protein
VIALSFNSPIKSSFAGALSLAVVDMGGGKATFAGRYTGVLTVAWFRIPMNGPLTGTFDSGLNGGLTASLDSGLNSPLSIGLTSGLNSGLNSDGLNSGLNGALNVTVGTSGLNGGLNSSSFTVPFVGSLTLHCTTCTPAGT